MNGGTVSIWIVENQKTGRFEAHVRGKSTFLLPAVEAGTEAAARVALEERHLRTSLAEALVRGRHMPDTLESRALAARVAYYAQLNIERTVTEAEISELALRVAPKAAALRKLIRSEDLKALWALIPGARDPFIQALDRLVAPKETLKELGFKAIEARGKKARGSRSAYLLQILVESWEHVFGAKPKFTKRFKRIIATTLKHYEQPVPNDLDGWAERELRKLKRSVIA